ncbi:MAG: glycerate kinase [Gemmatimonadales bacterium]|nr:glycerate kinase [Gemmatimonadales bacterium]NIN11202.1 glycerate kinase [Gemmatimonadales bacterium]NIN49801.1 glycerate kinase [Gemmatimonadales bacterium]NIP07265.1 glycerate kinase [Gemmatimonadales bacterium]NIR02960.1 glycerate kinase [Gemmatimonadales bacterium]
MAPRVVVVAQAFKETLPSRVVAGALERAVVAAGAVPQILYGSDGGDGLLDALAPRLERRTTHEAVDPLGRPLQASVGWLDATTAVVESRLVCGLSLLDPEERDPLSTSTRGVGQLILRVAANGARQVYVGLGGSATMDGGVGMARAWGWTPRDETGDELPEGGGSLAKLAQLDPGLRPEVALVGLCDVRNPLTGPRGARVYAPQKGASPTQVEQLARGMERLAGVAAVAGRAELAGHPGAGAAGGLGFGLLYFGDGTLQQGAGWVLRRIGFDAAISGAALVVAGEGAFDQTSLEGKLTGEVIRQAQGAGVPVLLLAPRASDVPPGVTVEAGGGRWSADDLERRAQGAVARIIRLLAN